MSTICELADGVAEKLNKFRLRKEKTIAAVVLKINTDAQLVEIEEEYDDISIDEIKDEIPEHQPRYVVLSYIYKHDDGRVSYPLCLLFYSPRGCKTELQVFYSGSVLHVQKALKLTKNFEIRELEDFDEDWLRGKLAFYR